MQNKHGLRFIVSEIKPNILVINLVILIRAILYGVVLGEAITFSMAVGLKISAMCLYFVPFLVVVLIEWIGVLVVCAPFWRSLKRKFILIAKSHRYDILIAFLTGVAFSLTIGGIGSSAYDWFVLKFQEVYFVGLIAILYILGLLLAYRAIQMTCTRKLNAQVPLFLNDTELTDSTDDLLDYRKSAKRFAEMVLNNSSSESMVFGLDGPWGIGKTTFLNFCKEHWADLRDASTIVYVFSPLKYDAKKGFVDPFFDGLIRELQRNCYVPEISPLKHKYSKLIKAKASFSIFGFEVAPDIQTVDDIFHNLESALSGIEKKMIVIIDDLDRENLSAIKEMIYAIKKCFSLPNISFILSYDTENINSLESHKPDADAIIEFLEKFVSVKYSLVIERKGLIDYFTTNKEIALAKNLQANPEIIGQVIGGLREICYSREYSKYTYYIGNIRKMKRLINTIVLLGVNNMDFGHSDFTSHDLIHLLLIYIYYPNIFRKIYYSETDGQRGLFSLITAVDADDWPAKEEKEADLNNRGYENSIRYSKFKEDLNENQIFLLDRVFNKDFRLGNKFQNEFSERIMNTFACFNYRPEEMENKEKKGNLEQYLELIIKGQVPTKHNQYQFYEKLFEKLKSGVAIQQLFQNEAFQPAYGEGNHRRLWKMIVNGSHTLDYKEGQVIIMYIVANIINYPYTAPH